MELEKPPLFLDYREFLVFVALLLFLLIMRLGFLYSEYQEFITKPFFYTYADVVHEYPKEGQYGSYKILKLQTQEHLTLYLSTRDYAYKNKRVRIQIFPQKEMGFIDYLQGFFIKGYVKERLEQPSTPIKKQIQEAITSQHQNPMIEAFYQAIYLATPLPRTLRTKVANLGVSHLIALSGLHLSLLSSVLFFLFLLPYRILQRHYFPYRNAFVDIGMVVLILLGSYTYFVDMPPSLLRSYAMLVVGWIALLLGFKLVSFEFLASVTLILLILFPKLIASLALWFSIAGVFYIFLMQQRMQTIQNKLLLFSVFPVGVYLFMLPLTHLFFDTTSPYQLSSPLTSIVFSLLYPLSIGLHLVGQGDLFDGYLIGFFNLSDQVSYQMPLTWEIFALFALLSIASIWSRLSFFTLIVVAFLYTLLLYLPLS